MAWNKNVTLDGNTQPTWQLVVVMILLLVAETIGDLSGCIGPGPDYESCGELCGDRAVLEIGVRYCKCGPVLEN